MNTAISAQQPDARAARELLAALASGAGLSVLTTDEDQATAPISRKLLDALPADTLVALIDSPRQNLLDFLHRTCTAFGASVPPEEQSISAFVTALRGFLLPHRQRRPLLVVDEAQEAPFYVLWQLLSLTQADEDGVRPMQVLLVGRPTLLSHLERFEMAPVAARVEMQARLTSWDLPADSPSEPEQPAVVFAPPDGEDEGVRPSAEPAPTPRMTRQTRPSPAPSPRRSGWNPWWLISGGAMAALLAAVFLLRGTGAPMPDTTVAKADAPGTPSPVPAGERVSTGSVPIAQTGHAAPVAPSPADEKAPGATSAPPAATPPAPPAVPEPAPLSHATPPEPAQAKRPALPPLADLIDDASATWGVLGRRWDARLSSAAPCEEALRQQLQCYRRPDMTLDLLRLLDRPGLVQLRAEGVTRWVHLQSMDERDVTLGSTGKTWTWSHSEFAQRWTGAYSTLWRLPPQQTGKVFTASADTAAGQWLDRQLKSLQASQKLGATEDSLSARVSALQEAHGWPADGKALPTVLLLVNRLVGVPEPRLMGPAPAPSAAR